MNLNRVPSPSARHGAPLFHTAVDRKQFLLLHIEGARGMARLDDVLVYLGKRAICDIAASWHYSYYSLNKCVAWVIDAPARIAAATIAASVSIVSLAPA